MKFLSHFILHVFLGILTLQLAFLPKVSFAADLAADLRESQPLINNSDKNTSNFLQRNSWLIKHHGEEIFLGALVILTAGGYIGYEIYQQLEEEIPLHWCISGACASFVKNSLPIMSAAPGKVAGKWMNELSQKITSKAIAKDLHKTAGIAVAGAGLVHGAISMEWDESLASRSGITGSIMMGAMAILGLSPLVAKIPLVKSNIGYEKRFLAVHRLAFLALIGAMLFHLPDFELGPMLAVSFGVVLLDHLLERLLYTYQTSAQFKEEADRILMTFDLPDMKTTAGDYFYIPLSNSLLAKKIPLTCAGSDSGGKLCFVMGQNGVSSENLIKELKPNKIRNFQKHKIVGPFKSPVNFGDTDSHLVLISGGTGYTVMISVLDELKHKRINNRKITLFHSDKKSGMFNNYLRLVKNAISKGVEIEQINLFVTEEENETNLERLAQPILEESVNFSIFSKRMNEGNLESILDIDKRKMHVCGSKELQSMVEDFCQKYNFSIDAHNFSF